MQRNILAIGLALAITATVVMIDPNLAVASTDYSDFAKALTR